MKKIILTFLLIINTLSIRSEVNNAWRINKDHSEIFFKIPYLSLSSVSGRFTDFIGRVRFDTQSNPSRFFLKIKAKSLFTGNKIRDGHLRSNEFFMVHKYEDIIFNSSSVIKLKSNKYKVLGSLQIKDIKKEISFIVDLTSSIKDSWGYENKFIKFKTTLSREEFGLKWNKSLKDSKYLLGDIINVWGKFQVQPLNTKTPSFKFMIPNTKFTSLKGKLIRGEIEQKEFDKQIEKFHQNKKQTKNVIKKPTTQKAKAVSTAKDTKIKSRENSKGAIWWISYYIMGFIGFLATLIICMQGKYFFMKLWPKKYDEVGIIGISSDLVVYAVAFIYVWAMWNLVYS